MVFKGIVLIPVYSEFSVLDTLIKDIPKELDILVIDDSGDNYYKSKRARIIHNLDNLGKGVSLRKGFDNVLSSEKYDYLIMMDADGEHNPKYLKEFMDKIEKNDIVFGQRKEYRSFSRKILNKFNSLWMYLAGINLKDVSCGFIAIKSPSLKKMRFSAKGFEIELEILLESARLGLKQEIVSIKVDKNSESSIKFKDYISMSNCFDSWILSNKIYLRKLNSFSRVILYFFCSIGLILGRIINK